jgi:hypothetical protein
MGQNLTTISLISEGSKGPVGSQGGTKIMYFKKDKCTSKIMSQTSCEKSKIGTIPPTVMIRNVILKHAFSDMVLATVSIKASFEFNWRHVNYFGEMQGLFDMDVQYGMHVSRGFL